MPRRSRSRAGSTAARVETRLRDILADELAYPTEGDIFRDESSLYGRGLGLDSVDVMALVIRIEAEFEIFFDDDELPACTESVGSLAREVLRRVERRAGAC